MLSKVCVTVLLIVKEELRGEIMQGIEDTIQAEGMRSWMHTDRKHEEGTPPLILTATVPVAFETGFRSRWPITLSKPACTFSIYFALHFIILKG